MFTHGLCSVKADVEWNIGIMEVESRRKIATRELLYRRHAFRPRKCLRSWSHRIAGNLVLN